MADSAGLAHDAGNLLGGLRLYCDLLDRPGVLSPQHRHYASELRVIAERSTRLLERLLASFDHERMIANSDTTPESRPTGALSRRSALESNDPAVALHELAPLLSRMVDLNTTVEVQAPASLPSWAFAAPLLTTEILERIVVNLVCNAAKALAVAQRPGLIRIVLHPSSTGLRLQIQDDGPGLAPGIAQSFLAPSPAPTERGLGHRIVHELTQATGGVLSIDSISGLGTVFTLQWTQPVLAEAPVVEPVAVNPTPTASLHRSGARTRTAPQASQEDLVRAC
ncbi:MAG: HAMP domain-containing sensor histidine kinase [Acidobacteriota bacterium]